MQKNVQRNAAISTQSKGAGASVPAVDSSNNVAFPTSGQAPISHAQTLAAAPPAARTAVEQKAQKLLLEAEKRALAKEQQLLNEQGPNGGAISGAMEEDGFILPKKKTGAGGMKAKVSKRKEDNTSDATASKKKADYVDLL